MLAALQQQEFRLIAAGTHQDRGCGKPRRDVMRGGHRGILVQARHDWPCLRAGAGILLFRGQSDRGQHVIVVIAQHRRLVQHCQALARHHGPRKEKALSLVTM